MYRNKFIFITVVFLLVLAFALFPGRTRAGCASGYYCYGTSVVDNILCDQPVLGKCGGTHNAGQLTATCDGNCSFRYCSSNDNIICVKKTFEGVDYCATTNCNTAGNCCALGGSTPAPGPGPTPTPAPTGMTMQVAIALDKNRNGVFDDGYYQVIEDPVDTNCGTFPNISGLTVDYSGPATGTIDYHTNCAGGTYNYPYSAKGILATGNFTFTLKGLPSNYSLKWIEEGNR